MNPLTRVVSALVALFLTTSWAHITTTSAATPDVLGYTGVVGAKAKGLPLSCGGKYNPEAPVAFHATLPCGSKITLLNPQTGAQVILPVVNNNVMFTAEDGRVADISPAAARQLGLDDQADEAAQVVLRQGASVMAIAPAQALPAPAARKLNQRDFKTLTNTLLGECASCGQLGMVAVAQIIQNRLDSAFGGASSIHAVVHQPKQFSYLQLNPSLKGMAGARPEAEHTARLFMQGRLSGEALAVQYRVGPNAMFYYAFNIMKTPKWGRSAKLQMVVMPQKLENELGHRFYAHRLAANTQIASR
ncbi:MAG: hypothetical protein GC129_06975 [Proteobacteria bacterium]|nr:hypothetical protein [Pseudomonadota bacterium]